MVVVLQPPGHAEADCFPATTISVPDTTLPTLPSTTLPATTVPNVCDCWNVAIDVMVTQPPPEVTLCP
jgi:hypothetical protein